MMNVQRWMVCLLFAFAWSGCSGDNKNEVPGDVSARSDVTPGDLPVDLPDGTDVGDTGIDEVLSDDAVGEDVAPVDAVPDGGIDADAGEMDLAEDEVEPVEPVEPGSLLWRYEHTLGVAYGPAIDGAGNLYLQGNKTVDTGPDGPTIISLTPDGAFRWGVRDVAGSVPAPPVTVAGETLVVPATRSDTEELVGRVSFYGLDGELVGQQETDGPMGDGAAWTAAGLVVAPARSVFAFEGGLPAWGQPFGLVGKGLTGTNVAVSPGGTLYVGCRGEDKSLYAIDPADGSEIWRRETGNAYLEPLAVDFDGNVYAVDYGGNLSVVSPAGEELWTVKVGNASGVALAGDGTIYISTAIGYVDGSLLAFRKGADGKAEMLWEQLLQHQGVTTPALSDGGTLYLGDNCRRFVAVDAATGVELWDYIPPEVDPAEDVCVGGWSSVTIGEDGTVYASTGHPGYLYAFAGDGTGPAQDSPWPMELRDAAHTSSLEW